MLLILQQLLCSTHNSLLITVVVMHIYFQEMCIYILLDNLKSEFQDGIEYGFLDFWKTPWPWMYIYIHSIITLVHIQMVDEITIWICHVKQINTKLVIFFIIINADRTMSWFNINYSFVKKNMYQGQKFFYLLHWNNE